MNFDLVFREGQSHLGLVLNIWKTSSALYWDSFTIVQQCHELQCCSDRVCLDGICSFSGNPTLNRLRRIFLQVIFSQTSENLERQSSMASSTEEVSGTNDLSTDSKHDTTDTEQKFGMYMREFDFLEYELESLEVMMMTSFQCLKVPDKFCSASGGVVSSAGWLC